MRARSEEMGRIIPGLPAGWAKVTFYSDVTIKWPCLVSYCISIVSYF